MKYIEKTFITGEKVEHESTISHYAYLFPYLIGLLFIPAYGLGLIILLSIWLTIWMSEYGITNKRIVKKVGLIFRSTDEIPISKVHGIEVNQGIFGRMFDYGDVRVLSGGDKTLTISSVKDPLKFRKEIAEIVDKINKEDNQ